LAKLTGKVKLAIIINLLVKQAKYEDQYYYTALSVQIKEKRVKSLVKKFTFILVRYIAPYLNFVTSFP